MIGILVINGKYGDFELLSFLFLLEGIIDSFMWLTGIMDDFEWLSILFLLEGVMRFQWLLGTTGDFQFNFF